MTDDYKSCDNCYYARFKAYAYPCSMCVRGMERRDMWMAKREEEEDEE